jgi:hypothetical protein
MALADLAGGLGLPAWIGGPSAIVHDPVHRGHVPTKHLGELRHSGIVGSRAGLRLPHNCREYRKQPGAV